MTRLQWTIAIALAALLGAGWTWLSRAPEGLDDIASPVAGRPAPDFALQATDGQSYALSDLRGQVVVVNFWATWCPPCRAEMPALQEVYDAWRDGGLIILAVDQDDWSDDTAERVRSFGEEFDLTFPLLLDTTYEVGRRYRITAMPTTLFIDRRGVIRDVIFGGPMSRALIEGKIQPLLEAR